MQFDAILETKRIYAINSIIDIIFKENHFMLFNTSVNFRQNNTRGETKGLYMSKSRNTYVTYPPPEQHDHSVSTALSYCHKIRISNVYIILAHIMKIAHRFSNQCAK
jgi:hypothetical protein